MARVDADGTLREVRSQVCAVAHGADGPVCRVLFQADVAAGESADYLLFCGNANADLPDYPTDLSVRGEGYGLDIENACFVARLSRQMGQLERLVFKVGHGLELFAGGEGHGEPPGIDWAHDYLASDRFQKFRVTNWASCPDYEVIRGPLCVQVRRWGFPHSPAHPLFTPSRMHMDVTYFFYAGLPYFLKEGSMEMVKDFEIGYLRDDEWVFSGYSFTDALWMDASGRLREGSVPRGQQDDLWGAGFYHRESRDAFIALWLEHSTEGFDGLFHSGTPQINYQGHGQLWSRWAARNAPRFQAGALLRQRNAYLVGLYPEEGGAAYVEETRRRLLNPLTVAPGSLPGGISARAAGQLARPGETGDTRPSKRLLREALRKVRDDMFYQTDSNVADMGYIYDLRVNDGRVQVLMTMPHRGRPCYNYLGNPIRNRLLQVEGVREVLVDFTWEPAWGPHRLTPAGRRAMGLE